MDTSNVKTYMVSEVNDVGLNTLNLITVGMFKTLAGKGIAVGDIVGFIPYQHVIPVDVAEALGVRKYLKHDGQVKAIKLQGHMSYGIAIPLPVTLTIDGDECTFTQENWNTIGAYKYEEPEESAAERSLGRSTKNNPLFFRFPDIPNIMSTDYPYADNTMVYITEKLHGMNARIGLIRNSETSEWELCMGSHNIQLNPLVDNIFTKTLRKYIGKLVTYFEKLHPDHQLILYGEIYGANIQKGFDYGKEEPDFKIFALLVDGYASNKYTEVPLLYRGEWGYIKNRLSAFFDQKHPDGTIQEGIVISEVMPGATALRYKYINSEYLAQKYKR